MSLRKVLTAVSISCRIFLALPNLEQEVFHFLSSIHQHLLEYLESRRDLER